QDGRTILPERLREHAGITTHITFVGLGEKFQMWEPGRFETHLAEARQKVRDLRKLLGAGRRGSGGPEGARGWRRGGGGGVAAAGGPAGHIPVILSEVIEALEPSNGKHFIDGTFGAGGYSRGLLESARCHVLAIDRDPGAVRFAKILESDFPGRLKFVLGRYAEMRDIAQREGIAAVDGVALDLGVSSMQLDEPERGFSFSKDGPLDMRMSGAGPRASDLVKELPERELAAVIGTLGEEKRARSIARAIVARRKEAPIARTAELADIVASVLGRRHDETKHPATRTFQALRLYLNEELL